MENLPGSLVTGLGGVFLGKFSQKNIQQDTPKHETAEVVARMSGKTERPHESGACGVIQSPPLGTDFNHHSLQTICSESPLRTRCLCPYFGDKLAELTPLGNIPNPAEKDLLKILLEKEGWQDLEKVHLREELSDKKG
ncbi:hypothetical protein BTVI_03067 [Pitangus sulphuratus]|nr:hypothetical protein BTVI_03067 [Pitangus sulphuratus]